MTPDISNFSPPPDRLRQPTYKNVVTTTTARQRAFYQRERHNGIPGKQQRPRAFD